MRVLLLHCLIALHFIPTYSQIASVNKPGRLSLAGMRGAFYFWDAPPTSDMVYIDFVGSGDIQKTVSEGKEINANTGLGIIFERYRGVFTNFQSLEFESYLNIFTTADTLIAERTNNDLTNRRQFSSYLLNPVSAKQSVYINANIYFGYKYKDPNKNKFPIVRSDLTKFGKFARIVSGLNARFIASNNIWKIGDTSRNLGALYARFGVFHEIVPDNTRIGVNGRSKYSCFFGINYSLRQLYGDLSSDKNADIRKLFLNTDRKTFGGLELNFGFRLKNLRAEFQMPILSDKKAAVEGLTNTQFLFSVKFVGGFGLKLNDD